jgi:hypothetical protein
LDTFLGIQWAESEGYLDAVGDIDGALLGPYVDQAAAEADLVARVAAHKMVPNPREFVHRPDGVYIRNTVYGPSVGGPQIRTMRDPSSGNHADTFRDAAKLHDDPEYQARAAWEISNHGTRFDLWSTYNSKKAIDAKGKDYTLRRGHPRAADWSK